MPRVCNIVLVCEGWRDSRFMRSFLGSSGNRKIHVKDNPRGCGSGHDWVKTQFVNEVANLKRFSEGRGVLGLLDEDGISSREKEITEALAARNLGSLSPSEGRCLLLPTRNLETWLYWLKSHQNGILLSIDETTDFKRQPPNGIPCINNRDCQTTGEYLHTLDHTQLPDHCPSMLRKGLLQLRNFVEAVSRS